MDPNSHSEADNRSIGALRIDPAAEPIESTGSLISGQQELDFFKKTGAHFQLAHNQQNWGVLGKLFGSNSSAPTNIAGFVIICSFIVIVVSLFFPGNSDLLEARKWLIGLITSAMSFLFGAASKK